MSSLVDSRVAKNFLALVILQGGNYLLPLIMIPFLVRVLGLNTFGEWSFALAFVAVFRTCVSYGYDLTGTRAVAIHRDDGAFIGRLFGAIVVSRLVILIACCLALCVLALLLGSVQGVLVLALLSMLVLVGEAIFPVWLFQGLESMATITKVRLTYRALFVLSVILLVRRPEDVLLIPLLEGVGSLAAGVVAVRIASTRHNLRPRLPSFEAVVEQFRTGASVFVSLVAVHFYTSINTILLGIIAGPVAVGQYSIAEKVYGATRGMLGPVVQALFPALSRLSNADLAEFRRETRKVILGYTACLVPLALLLFASSGLIVEVIVGARDAETIKALQILAVAITLAIGTLFAGILVAQRRDGTLMAVTLATAIMNLLIVVPCVNLYGAAGAALALLVTQAFHVAFHLYVQSELLWGHLPAGSAIKSTGP